MNPATFRSKLKVQLDALSAYQTLKVDVFRYPPGSLARTKPTLFIRDAEQVELTDFTLVGNQEERWTITGGAYAPSAGASDTEWATAEENAYTIIDTLADQLVTDPTVNGACNRAKLTSWSSRPSQGDSGIMFVDVEWTITARVFP